MNDLSKENKFIKIAEDFFDICVLNKKDEGEKRVVLEEYKHIFEFDSHVSQMSFDFIYSARNYFQNEIEKRHGYDNQSHLKSITIDEFDKKCQWTDERGDIILNHSEYIDNLVEKSKKHIFHRNKKVRILITYPYNYTVNDSSFKNSNVYKEYKKTIDYLENTESLTFDDLWQYCQFVRWAEKVIFYNQNDVNSPLYVDTKMNDMEKRKFSISYKKTTVIFILDNLEDVFSDTEKTYKHISINVDRDFGKHLTTRYDVMDNSVEYKDDSDLYLINSINKLLNNIITNNFKSIIENIITGQFYGGATGYILPN